MDFWRAWWQQPSNFAFLDAYLAERGMRRFVQLLLASLTAGMATMPVTVLFSSVEPRTAAETVVLVAATASAMVMALCWLVGFPTQRQSQAFVVAASLSIAAGCLVDGNALAAMIGATIFAMVGGYVAIFHDARLLAVNSVVAAATTSVLALRVAREYDVALAVAKTALLAVAVCAIPVVVQRLIQYLRREAHDARLDPLCGLLNRRSFTAAVAAMVDTEHFGEMTCLCLVMADIDHFKDLNDTRGHAVGDRALVAVAAALRQFTPDDAPIGRVGGEEFLVAVRVERDRAADVAETVRAAIASTVFDITASGGVAVSTEPGAPGVLETLAARADMAMYEAKRLGGNRVAFGAQARPIVDR